MRYAFLISCSLFLLFSSCKKEEEVHAYYPRTLQLTQSDWNYHSWLNGVESTNSFTIGELFPPGSEKRENYVVRECIIFLNDSELYFGANPDKDFDIKNHKSKYYFRNDTLFEIKLDYTMQMGIPYYTESYVGIGTRTSIRRNWAILSFGYETFIFGALYYKGNYTLASLAEKGFYGASFNGSYYNTESYSSKGVITDTLGVINFTDQFK